MIEAGKTFCPYCLEVHEGAYYSNANITWGVWLNRKRPGGKYVIEVEDFGKDKKPQGRFVLQEGMGSTEKLPNDIQVQILDEKSGQKTQQHRLYRGCPICARDHNRFNKVNYILGRYPTFVVVMIGDRWAGKSAFLDAIATGGNTEAVNRAGYERYIQYTTPATDDGTPQATDRTSRGKSKVLMVCDKQDNQVVAVVYLVDVAGEAFNPQDQEGTTDEEMENLVWNLLSHNGAYPGADGMIFVASAVTKTDEHGVVQTQHRVAQKIYTRLCEAGLLAEKPLAYVMTHADKLVEEGNFKMIRSQGTGDEVPSMTRDTFDLTVPTSYKRKDLLPRVALEHAIVRPYNSAVFARMDGPTKGFLVRSCALSQETVLRPDGKTKIEVKEDFLASRNVMDPLIWMLNQLKLFPLRERGE